MEHNKYTVSFVNDGVARICPNCDEEMELDTTIEENGYLYRTLCNKCGCSEIYAFETFEDAEAEMHESEDRDYCEIDD